MQIQHLHKNYYKFYQWSRTQECLDAYRIEHEEVVKRWEKLSKSRVPLEVKQEITGISQATYYRYKAILNDLKKGIAPPSKKPKKLRGRQWGESEMQLVLKIRRVNPTYGKAKISTIIKRDHQQPISESTVGRILSHLMKKGLITKSRSALKMKKKRIFNGHAKPWTYKSYSTFSIGERVQIDHMTVTKNGVCVKHFQAWERQSKHIHAGVYSKATAKSAKRFLIDLLKVIPYKLLSIQVDGGSEFRAEFEEACAELNIPLIILPPAMPKYNGGVERGNRIFREEFYADPKLIEDSVRGIQAALSKALIKYNTYRPHFNLKNLTPMEYINKNLPKAA